MLFWRDFNGLVPKLQLGYGKLSAKLCFDRGSLTGRQASNYSGATPAKRSFKDKCVPKLELGRGSLSAKLCFVKLAAG